MRQSLPFVCTFPFLFAQLAASLHTTRSHALNSLKHAAADFLDLASRRLPELGAEAATAAAEAEAAAARVEEAEEHEKGVPHDAADALHVEPNKKGDFKAFLSTIALNVPMTLIFFCAAAVLRYWYPSVYCNNSREEQAPAVPDGVRGMISATWSVSTSEAVAIAGLDNALLVEFCKLGMSMMLKIGLPLTFILGPLHVFLGHVAGQDELGWISLNHVESHHWLHWLHAGAVWYVVIVVRLSVFQAQQKFLALRTEWLRKLPKRRASTVMVEGIPEERRSDAKLREFFEQMFPGREVVQDAFVVKRMVDLELLVERRKAAHALIELIEADKSKMSEPGEKSVRGPLRRNLDRMLTGKNPSTIFTPEKETELRLELEDVQEQISKERARIETLCAEPGGVNLSSGFITFVSPNDAVIASRLTYSHDRAEWRLSLTPPEPRDILWDGLKQSGAQLQTDVVVGYFLVIGLYLAYVPIILGVAHFAIRLDLGPLQPLWVGVAPSLGLQFMVSMMPTLLILIFSNFFPLKAEAHAQHKLHAWYFLFLLVFVVLVVPVGNSLMRFVMTVAQHPFKIFPALADTMPNVTHFYLNFLVLQWSMHASNLLRYMQLAKFLAMRVLYDEAQARLLAEPENQDFHGLGSRSARLSVDMLLGIIFCTLSPLTSLVACLNFLVYRLVYGYLVVFAETKKPDLGGIFWVTKLHCIFGGLAIHCIMMTGVLQQRASSPYPSYIAFMSIFYCASSYIRFNTAFSWEDLTFPEVISSANDEGKDADFTYKQPELLETWETGPRKMASVWKAVSVRLQHRSTKLVDQVGRFGQDEPRSAAR